MYYISVAIYGYSQLKKIYTDKFIDFINKLDDVSKVMGANFFSDETPSLRLYTIPSTYKESFYVALQLLLSLSQSIKENKDMVRGFNLVLFEDDDSYPNVNKYMYALKKDNCCWISSDLEKKTDKWIKTENIGIVSLIHEVENNNEANHLLCEHFLRQRGFGKKLKEAFRRLEYGDNVVLNIFGKESLGKRYTIKHYIEQTKEVDFLWIKTNANNIDPLSSFYKALSVNILNGIAKQIEGKENPVLSHVKYMIDNIIERKISFVNRKVLIRNLQVLFNIYLKVYKKQFTSSDYRPFIVIENPAYFPSYASSLVDFIVETCLKEKILVINISKDPVIYDFCSIIDFSARNNFSISDFWDSAFFKGLNLDEATPHAVLLYYWNIKNAGAELELPLNISNVLKHLSKQLDPFSIKILYIISLVKGRIYKNDLINFIHLLKLDKTTILGRMKTFYEIDLIQDEDYPELSYSEMENYLSECLGEEVNEINENLAISLYKELKNGRFFDYLLVFSLLEKTDLINEALDVLQIYFNYEINFNNIDNDVLNAKNYFANKKLDSNHQAMLNLILASAKLQKQLINNSDNINIKALSGSFMGQLDEKNIHVCFWLLKCRKFYNAKGESNITVYEVKDILYQFQRQSHKVGEIMASLEMTYTLFRRGVINQAIEYSEITEKLCDNTKNNYAIILNYRLQISCAMAIGNLSLALKIATKGLELASKNLMIDKEIFFLFVKGRVYFECGEYNNSIKAIDDALRIANLYNKTKSLNILENWKARSYAYLGNFAEAIKLLEKYLTAESLYFLAECYYLQKDLSLAYKTIAKACNVSEEKTVLELNEKESWIDGFLLLEGRIDPLYLEVSLLAKLISYFNLYLRGLVDNREEVLEIFAKFDFNRFIAKEPFSYLYLHYYIKLLSDKEHKELRVIVQNKADRLLNNRAGKFDDLSLQKGFLKHNDFNSKFIS